MSTSKEAGLGGLMDALARLRKLNGDMIRGIIDRSASPELMARAYDGLLGELSAVDGRTAMRAALQADNVSGAEINAIYALYLNCVVA